jgi:hypothetical protein
MLVRYGRRSGSCTNKQKAGFYTGSQLLEDARLLYSQILLEYLERQLSQELLRIEPVEEYQGSHHRTGKVSELRQVVHGLGYSYEIGKMPQSQMY